MPESSGASPPRIFSKSASEGGRGERRQRTGNDECCAFDAEDFIPDVRRKPVCRRREPRPARRRLWTTPSTDMAEMI